MRFNSIVSIELSYKGSAAAGPGDERAGQPGRHHGHQHGQGRRRGRVWAKIIGTHNDCAGRPLEVLEDVYKSESDTNQRNQAIGMLMYAYGYIKSEPRCRRSISTRGSARSA